MDHEQQFVDFLETVKNTIPRRTYVDLMKKMIVRLETEGLVEDNKSYKPNTNQINVCEGLKMCIDGWQVSNDISSPSHFNLIETLVHTEMMDYADDELKDEIIEKMQDLYISIRKIK